MIHTMYEPAPGLRRLPLILGCSLALLFGVAHVGGHIVFFLPDHPRPDLAASRAAMLASTVEAAGMRTTRWDLFLFFSLSLSIGTIAFGTLGLTVLRASGWLPAVERCVAAVGLVVALALLAAGAAHRVLQPVVGGALMTMCFVAAWRPGRT